MRCEATAAGRDANAIQLRRLPQRAGMTSAGEDRLAAALERELRDPWRIYRNVAWLAKRPGNEPQDGEADVVLAHPELGVMVIEVKGGGVRRTGVGRWESV